MSTYVYRLFDAEGRLLYVGQTVRPDRRVQDHRLRKSWGGQIARVDLTEPMDRESALKHEAAAINTERPVYNINRSNGSQYFGAGPDTPEAFQQREAEFFREHPNAPWPERAA